MLALPPLGVYVHIPWCVRKCPYCDFNSHANSKALPEQEYLAALRRDLQAELPYVQGRKISSVFFGGGTPSLFSAAAIAEILAMIDGAIGFTPDVEITLEANPGTTDQHKFTGYLRAGVNRLSVGVQSFDSQHLANLGRIHSSDDAISAVEAAKAVGFTRINIDLMHGLPNQSQTSALQDLRIATGLAVEHISWYQLTIEPNTVFYSNPPVLPPDDNLALIQEAGTDWLLQEGYSQYEVSAFAKPGGQCRHNLNYWQFGDYLGLGAGAHGKLTNPHLNTIARRRKTRQPDNYIQAVDPLAGVEFVEPEERLLELSMNALRLVGGVSADLVAERIGRAIPWAQLQPLMENKLLAQSTTQYVTTSLGYKFLNETLARIDKLTSR